LSLRPEILPPDFKKSFFSQGFDSLGIYRPFPDYNKNRSLQILMVT